MAEPRSQNYYQSRTGKPNPSTSHFLVLATLVPLGATLLLVAALILTATVIGLTVATPLFVIFSPVLLPATLVIALVLAGFLTSGAFGVTSLSSFAWLAAYLRRSRSPEHQQHAKPPALDIVGHEAQKNEEVEDSIERKAQEAQNETGSKAQETDREVKKETARKNQQTGGQETQKENSSKSQETGQEAQKETGETEKARKENKISS